MARIQIFATQSARAASTLFALLLMVGLTLSNAALATPEAWDFASAPVGNPLDPLNNGLGYSLGELFVPTENMILDSLGYYANGGAGGFSESHPVAIYDASGDLLVSTTINNSSNIVGHFAFNAVTPIVLLAGQTYVIDGYSGVVDLYTWDDTGFQVYAPITLLGDNEAIVGTPAVCGVSCDIFTSTNLGFPFADGVWGANFGWDPVPEPTSLTLFGTALLGLGFLRRRKKAA